MSNALWIGCVQDEGLYEDATAVFRSVNFYFKFDKETQYRIAFLLTKNIAYGDCRLIRSLNKLQLFQVRKRNLIWNSVSADKKRIITRNSFSAD